MSIIYVCKLIKLFTFILARPAQLLFFYGPISIILFSNLLMSIHTIIMIIKQTKYAKVFNESERRKENQEKENVKLVLKILSNFLSV